MRTGAPKTAMYQDRACHFTTLGHGQWMKSLPAINERKT
jgi:hypothetical protein